MTGLPPIIDAAERALIEHGGLDRTLFVEAGAGTGKTHELVERVSRLVIDDGVPLRDIAAITFTEAAGAELRDRIRETFEKRLEADPPETIRLACEAALADTDVAAIGTLHSFALRILSEHPLEVDLPPSVEILDEVSSQLAFADRWRTFVDDLHADPATVDLVLWADALAIPIEPPYARSASLEDVAAIFSDNWDRLSGDEPHPGPLPDLDWPSLERALRELQLHPARCSGNADKLHTRIVDVIVPEVQAVLAEPDLYRRLRAIDPKRIKQWKSSGLGAAGSWAEVKDARSACDGVGAAAATIRDQAVRAVLERLRIRLADFTRRAARHRQREGRLEFHDLLVLARELVRTSPGARAALHQRYQRLLLDEFQDTDPIQIEIATLIAGTVAGPAPAEWADVLVEPGRLFFVGDPKQSIYRFRRADIEMFMEAKKAFAGDDAVPLVQNFRTVAPVLDWVNHVFLQVMPEEVPGAQPAYRALAARRTDHPGDHRVVLLGGEHDLRAPQLREVEAEDVATAIALVRDRPDQWPVFDEKLEEWRPPRLSDITVLLPTRTSLRQLEDAFDRHAIAYRVDTGTLVYDTQEVREVLGALRAVDDPTDELALVATLRSPLYGCSDADLFTFVDGGGRWSLRRTPPPALAPDHPVVAAMAHLRTLADDRWWCPPSELMSRLLGDRQAFALALAHRRPREVWRRLRFLVDQAHQFEEAGGGGLRSFLAWTELQAREGSRVHEPLLPETDDDAVSIMTIHGAKGLEFPITVVAGVTTALGKARRGVEVHWEAGRAEIKLSADKATEHFDRLADLEAEMDVYERERLLYVACTRARDHLIVCTHHAPGVICHGATLARTSEGEEDRLWRRLPDHVPSVPVHLSSAPSPVVDDREAWIARRTALLGPQRSARFVSATAVARMALEPVEPGLVGDRDGGGADIDPDLGSESDTSATDESGRPAFSRRRGRAGTAIGRAVHATLQLVDLATGEHLDQIAAQQAHAEAIPHLAGTVAGMARSGLASHSVQQALAGGRLWRELYVAAPLGERAVEGYIDLLYESDQGLVIVDYKTDSVGSEAEVDAKLHQYRLQLATYAEALEASTGLRVAAGRLVFCRASGALERDVSDLAGARAEVRSLLGAV